MKQFEMDEKLAKIGFIAVLQTLDENEAVRVAKMLVENKIFALEIAYRDYEHFFETDECIKAVCREVPEIVVGAGTVLNKKIAKRAKKAGAKFCLSPGFNEKTVKYCLGHNFPIYPGVATATEIEKAVLLGLKTLKIFPIEVIGGTKLLNAFFAPFPRVRFIVSGGVNEKNCSEYQKLKNVAAVSGSWLCAKK